MSNAVAQAALSAQPFPLTTVAGPVLFELVDSAGTAVSSQAVGATAADAEASATFSNVAPNTGYRVRVTRVDNSGAALQVPVLSDPFDVTATTTTITVASGVTVTVS
jgi:hypothetical protein